MAKNIFRKNSLENSDIDNDLENIIFNTSYKGWLVLLTFAIIIFIAILWSIYGSIPTKIQGNGILLKNSGIGKIYSNTNGTIKDIFIKNGDIVKKDELIAIVNHPEKIIKIDTLKEIISNLKEKYKKISYKSKLDLDLTFGVLQRDKENIKENIKFLKLKIKSLQKSIKNKKRLYKRKQIKYETLLKEEEILMQMNSKLKKAKSDLILKNIEAFNKKRDRENELELIEDQIIEAKRKLRELERNLQIESEIRSNFTGKIFALSISKGSDISEGEMIAGVEKEGKKNSLEALFFVPAIKGKMIRKGFKTQVSPSTVRREEYGSIIAKVTYVADFPATKESVLNILHNKELTDSFLKSPVIMVKAKLEKNSNNFSGYQWSSSKGPKMHITSGTLCEVEVIVKEQAPITLVIPIIKKVLSVQ